MISSLCDGTAWRKGLMVASGLGFDPDALREKYRVERDRRLRPDGIGQYRGVEGEFAGFGDDPHAVPDDREPLADTVDVLVIGGGFGGLLAGARLRQAGVPGRVRLVDDGADFGGTWHWNRYPGIHCDIESYVYLPLLEELDYVPKWKYAPGEEIREHARAIARHFDLCADAVFQTRVTELRWDEDAWVVATDRGDAIRAKHVIASSGTLSRPKLPGIPGIETFRGHMFHTSRWDYDYTGGGLTGLADKRVAVIGAGAIQIVPHLGRDAQSLHVFQRTPSSVDVRGNRPTAPEWTKGLGPGWQRRRRHNFLSVVSGPRRTRTCPPTAGPAALSCCASWCTATRARPCPPTSASGSARSPTSRR
ncbi:flavin-containing monooxygenase [Actinokineospora sp. G85]|uniref:flavin-containing monooxygenase n=1 Tax=Actinokineospora sp. G85 TaxID=3406626 RepID=UPI003C72A12F